MSSLQHSTNYKTMFWLRAQILGPRANDAIYKLIYCLPCLALISFFKNNLLFFKLYSSVHLTFLSTCVLFTMLTSSTITASYMSLSIMSSIVWCPKGVLAALMLAFPWCKRTEWSPIRSVIIRVITKSRESDLLIMSMITDRHRTTRSPLTN